MLTVNPQEQPQQPLTPETESDQETKTEAEPDFAITMLNKANLLEKKLLQIKEDVKYLEGKKQEEPLSVDDEKRLELKKWDEEDLEKQIKNCYEAIERHQRTKKRNSIKELFAKAFKKPEEATGINPEDAENIDARKQ